MKKRIIVLLVMLLVVTNWAVGNDLQAASFRAENALSYTDYLERPYQTLPPDFPKIDVLTKADGVGDGYLFVSNFNWGDMPNSHPYIMILDNNGEPIFAREVEGGAIDFKPQPNGRLTYFDRGLGHYVVLDHTYTPVDTIAAGNGYDTDLHELLITEEEHAILMIYDPQPVDMSKIIPGGDPNAIVIGLVLQELDENDNVIFEWRSWDHFEITDATVDISGANVDYAHGNSIDIDDDGNWIISSRHMDEVTKINRQTGEIMWRLGGKNNQFSFTNEAHKFYHQHDARRLENGNLLLFDNGGPGFRLTSRAIEYALDEINMTAEAVRIFTNTPEIFSLAMGSARRLPNGNTLVGWGSGYPAITEFRPDGSKAFELAFDAPLVSYRAIRASWEGLPNKDPLLLGSLASGQVQLNVSWNGATNISEYEIYGGNSPNPTTLVTVVPRAGYETTVRLENVEEMNHFRVMPITDEGEPTTFSNEVSVAAYQLFIPFVAQPTAQIASFATSDPAAYSWVGNGTYHVIYRGGTGYINELWYSNSTGWRQNNIGQLTNAPIAEGKPSAYVWEQNESQHVFYKDEAGHVQEIWYRDDGGWQHNNLSEITNAPAAASDPFGYVWSENGSQHVIYRGENNHIYEIWKRFGNWQYKDLTLETNGVLASGTPAAYVWEADSSQHIIYRGVDGQVHELWYKPSTGWVHKAIGAETNALAALGDPVGFASEINNEQHIFYRGIDGRVHELLWSASSWEYRYLGLEHVVASTISLATDANENGYSIFYRKTDGNVYRLWFDGFGNDETELVSGGVSYVNLKSNPVAFWANGERPAVVYRGDGGEIYYHSLSLDDSWQFEEISQLKP
ncbi:MAG: hypothetical protein DHS20C20_03940 [Ardenticatenaceae bacterium]|nr:MAG: hypothetical protein DHS20C20_03940 [Ardenticatenaceae bacterium]